MRGSRTWRKTWSVSTTLALLTVLGCGGGAEAPANAGASGAAAEPAPATAPAEEPGAESPEALVERLRSAAKANDMGEMAACMTPESRAEMAKGMYFAATMMVAFSAMGAEMGNAMAEGMDEMADEMAGEDVQQDEEATAEAKADAEQKVADLTARYNELVSKYGLPEMTDSEEEMTDPPDDVFETIDHSAFLNDVMAFMNEVGDEGGMSGDPAAVPEGELTDLVVEGDRATGMLGGETLHFVQVDGRWYADMQAGEETGEEAAVEGETE